MGNVRPVEGGEPKMRSGLPTRRWHSCTIAPALLLLTACASTSESFGPPPLWGVVLYFGLVLLVVGAMLGLSYVLGERHAGKARDEPYESAIPPTGSGHMRFDVKFYAVAMFFVIFDIETVFILAWALAARELGWSGYIEIVIFVAILVAALVYLWRTGALAWGSSARLSQRTRMRRPEKE
jgi:NADH-quinone oxidoreductase subunit A